MFFSNSSSTYFLFENFSSIGGFQIAVLLSKLVNMVFWNSSSWSLNTKDKLRLFLPFSDKESTKNLVVTWLSSVGSELRVICLMLMEELLLESLFLLFLNSVVSFIPLSTDKFGVKCSGTVGRLVTLTNWTLSFFQFNEADFSRKEGPLNFLST